uniref:Lipid droplet-associated hydrolase n=1 Tax=Cannabis sativa TaxID=3483 RepID=A0A803QMM0_CANSA
MGRQVLQSKTKKLANFRLCNVSSYATEILEIIAEKPVFHALVIPGNPGAVLFYKEFVESLYEWLGGSVSVTAVGHISHTKKDSERGRLFSLQEQIDHKIDFIKHELQNKQVPIILVGHSIGAYMCIEMFKRNQEQVLYYIGLYPFLALDLQSQKQSIIGKIAASPVVSVVLSSIVASLGFLPSWALRLIVSKSVGKSWSSTAVEVTCSHLTKFHTMRNVLFMAMTEFKKLSETPDWTFMREKHHRIAFLFGIDDHWGPLQMYEEVSDGISLLKSPLAKL